MTDSPPPQPCPSPSVSTLLSLAARPRSRDHRVPAFPGLNEHGGTQQCMRGFADWSLRGILSNGTPAALGNRTTRHSRKIAAGAGETLENLGTAGRKKPGLLTEPGQLSFRTPGSKGNFNLAVLLECAAQLRRSPFCWCVDKMQKPLTPAEITFISCT